MSVLTERIALGTRAENMYVCELQRVNRERLNAYYDQYRNAVRHQDVSAMEWATQDAQAVARELRRLAIRHRAILAREAFLMRGMRCHDYREGYPATPE